LEGKIASTNRGLVELAVCWICLPPAGSTDGCGQLRGIIYLTSTALRRVSIY
jgi:hypothetical protein